MRFPDTNTSVTLQESGPVKHHQYAGTAGGPGRGPQRLGGALERGQDGVPSAGSEQVKTPGHLHARKVPLNAQRETLPAKCRPNIATSAAD